MASATGHRMPNLSSFASKQRVTLTKPRRSALSTTSRASRQTQLRTPRQRPRIVARIPPKPLNSSPTLALRHASSTSSPASNTQTEVPSDILTWDRFFDLRKKRRYLNLGSSAVTAAGAIGIFGPVIAQQDLDGWAAQVSGIDPIFVLGLTTFAVAAGGWLCGPSLGNSGFKIWAGRRGWNRGIAEKEKSFYDRIKRYRADPAASSPQNPIPDYYGEKIASVKDYRRWLKDQRAFNLKKNKAII